MLPSIALNSVCRSRPIKAQAPDPQQPPTQVNTASYLSKPNPESFLLWTNRGFPLTVPIHHSCFFLFFEHVHLFLLKCSFALCHLAPSTPLPHRVPVCMPVGRGNTAVKKIGSLLIGEREKVGWGQERTKVY